MGGIVKISPLAETDLIDIAIHISVENPPASEEFLRGMDDKFSILLSQPEMGRQRKELGENLRSLAFNNYVVFYDPRPEGILIVRVLHGARDIGNFF
jgi:toxin ParE1/3/4